MQSYPKGEKLNPPVQIDLEDFRYIKDVSILSTFFVQKK